MILQRYIIRRSENLVNRLIFMDVIYSREEHTHQQLEGESIHYDIMFYDYNNFIKHYIKLADFGKYSPNTHKVINDHIHKILTNHKSEFKTVEPYP